MTYEPLHDLLKQEGFVIYAGQAGLYHSIFRIANMGDISDADLARLLDVFRKRFGATAA
jgi:2-aminoethylphosphonate-pyruvate transaminase